MSSTRCPHLYHLGRELLEAYRQVSNADLFRSSYGLDSANSIVIIHRKMAEHRGSCPLCRQMERDAVGSLTKSAVGSSVSG